MAKKQILGFILWVLGLLVIWQVATNIFVPKWLRGNGTIPPYTEIVNGFYDEPENSLDVMFVGSSQVYCGINPLVLWEEYGITSYNLATPCQPMQVSYFYMKELFKTQKPRVVFFDVLDYDRGYSLPERHSRPTYDYAKNSMEKWQSLKLSLEHQEDEESFFYYLFPLAQYHSRYMELEEIDYAYMFSDKHNEFHGFFPQKLVWNSDEEFFSSGVQEELVVEQSFVDYLIKMKTLCEENKAELVLMKTPTYDWGYQDYETIDQMAEELGLKYLDYTCTLESTEIDFQTDFLDKGHLNIFGAEKLTKCIGEFLDDSYNMIDHRLDSDYQIWNEDYLYYLEYIEKLPCT